MTTCSFRGCDRDAIAKSLCGSHYRQLYRRGSVERLTPLRLEPGVRLPAVTVPADVHKKLKVMGVSPNEAIKTVLVAWARRH